MPLVSQVVIGGSNVDFTAKANSDIIVRFGCNSICEILLFTACKDLKQQQQHIFFVLQYNGATNVGSIRQTFGGVGRNIAGISSLKILVFSSRIGTRVLR